MKSIYQALAELEATRQPAVLCTVVRTSGSTPRRSTSKMLVYPDGSILGTVGGGEMESRVIREALEALQDGKTRLLSYNMTDPSRGDPGVCGGQVEVFVEPVLPPPTLLVLGGGHVGKAVVHLAHFLGFYVILSDDRPEFCSPESVPDADEYLPVPLQEITQQVNITPHTWVVLTTRGVSIDAQALPPLLASPAAYIGVIGSRRRWAMTCKELLAQGVPEEHIARVHSPIGLEIEAETPEEIAVSIMAEIIMLRNGGDGKPMSAKA
ncbi:MAG: xanthine dehydrogenase [Anaerolineae bacterium]|nr:MAG: xanthine dehydrogenase [Anaerolineae bacterium]